MKKIGGVNKITLNGTEYGLAPGLEYSLSTATKEVVTDQGGKVIGYKEKDFRAPYIKGSLILGNNTSPDFMTSQTSISAEVVIGDVVLIGSDGVNVTEEVHKTDDGTLEFEIRFTSLVRA